MPVQEFVIRSDVPSGSTIGPATAGLTGATTVDFGAALQLLGARAVRGVGPGHVRGSAGRLPCSALAGCIRGTQCFVVVYWAWRFTAAMAPSRRLSMLLVACVLGVTACTGQDARRQTARTPTQAAKPASCATSVQIGSLPTWARVGFTPPTHPVPHVVGANGNIVAILFGHPLHSPPQAGRANKIRWMSKVSVDGDPLKIDAKLNGSNVFAKREVPGGPGASYVDLPAAGCWSLDLSWSGHQDAMSIPYFAG